MIEKHISELKGSSGNYPGKQKGTLQNEEFYKIS